MTEHLASGSTKSDPYIEAARMFVAPRGASRPHADDPLPVFGGLRLRLVIAAAIGKWQFSTEVEAVLMQLARLGLVRRCESGCHLRYMATPDPEGMPEGEGWHTFVWPCGARWVCQRGNGRLDRPNEPGDPEDWDALHAHSYGRTAVQTTA